MGLVGVIDPSHAEAKASTSGRYPRWVSLDEALTKSADPKWAPWPKELLAAMFAEHQDRGDMVSSSAVVAWCPRAEVIARKEDYVGTLEDLYIPFRGTMVHRTMELYALPGSMAEYRFWSTLDGVRVSCSPDHLEPDVLSDYKVTDNPPMYNNPYTHHNEQVQLNAYICRNADAYALPGEGYDTQRTSFSELPFDPRGTGVKAVRLVYMSPKKPKVLVVEHTEQTFSAKTGKFGKAKVPFVWSDNMVEKTLGPRARLFKQALDIYPEWPEGAENLWGGEAGWKCPGPPLCGLPSCLAKRWPNNLTWELT